jgi:hypothetical protein
MRALLRQCRLPSATMLYLGRYFSTHAVRARVETACRASCRIAAGRVWVALDSHRSRYWAAGKFDQVRAALEGGQVRAAESASTDIRPSLRLAGNSDKGSVLVSPQ